MLTFSFITGCVIVAIVKTAEHELLTVRITIVNVDYIGTKTIHLLFAIIVATIAVNVTTAATPTTTRSTFPLL